jgi:hypothetical protein
MSNAELIKRLEGAGEMERSRDGCRDFTCAICQRNVDMRFNRYWRKEAHIAPICRNCEIWYAAGQGKPTGGTFMDRRNVTRGLAITEALRTEAATKAWRTQHG